MPAERQPSLRHFVKTIEEIARHYQILRKSIITATQKLRSDPGFGFQEQLRSPALPTFKTLKAKTKATATVLMTTTMRRTHSCRTKIWNSLRCLPEQEEVL
ncbi:hypothetical protein GQ600_18921 [Phytophthora cactorum]|nr:hypothetical protein GQ600_18921 [Phytophthora cactorum]